jgi:hypothetical protein
MTTLLAFEPDILSFAFLSHKTYPYYAPLFAFAIIKMAYARKQRALDSYGV